jgi:hypothetical protein
MPALKRILYERALALFYQQGVMKDTSKDLGDEAIDAIKMTYYNKASIRTACIVKSITATKPSQPPDRPREGKY